MFGRLGCLSFHNGCVLLRRVFTDGLGMVSWAAMDGSLPIVTIIGRPNVGKSALFNRLVKRKEAMVFNTPKTHVTRDHKTGIAALGDLKFSVVDTSGFEPEMNLDTIQARATRLTAELMRKADIAVFLLDARQGLTPIDEEVGAWLRKHCSSVHVILVANKSEGITGRNRTQIASTISESWKLGFGEPVGISAETGEGFADFYSALQPHIDVFFKAQVALQESHNDQKMESQNLCENDADKTDISRSIKVAIMGLPNVGKSTLMNHLLGKSRCLVGPEPGLTRDTVCDGVHYDGWSIELSDTAGWMKRTQFGDFDECGGKLALVSQHKTKDVMNFAHVVVLLVDAESAARKDLVMLRRELSLAGNVLREGRSLIVVLNKIDSLSREDQEIVKQEIPTHVAKILHEMDGLPCLSMSALTGEGVSELLPAIIDLYKKWNRRIPTNLLNQWMREVGALTSVQGMASGGSDKVKFVAQTKMRPPTFSLHVSGKGQLTRTNIRTLTRSLRTNFNFDGVPVRLLVKRAKSLLKR